MKRISTDLEEIRSIEERALNAWPARHSLLCGGWVLRLSGGYTKRANSANALAPVMPFADLLAVAEDLYGRHQLTPIFRLTPLAGTEPDTALDHAGYRFVDRTLVMTASIGAGVLEHDGVTIRSSPDTQWLDGFASANGTAAVLRPIHDAMVWSIAMPTAFATVMQDGAAVGFGLAVIERGMVGLFDIVVAQAYRRCGAGRRTAGALLHWARSLGAERAYLQVVASNHAAIELYQRFGFSERYEYYYRVRE